VTDVPRSLPRYVHPERTRHGEVAFYFRRGHEPRTRLPAPTADTFLEEYHAALMAAGITKPRGGPANGTLAWLIDRYRETTAWSDLSAATRRQRENIFKGVIETTGHHRIGKVTAAQIVKGRDRRAATPAQARNFLDAMRGLFRWAVEATLARSDPTAAVRNPKRKTGDGFLAWTDDDVAAFEARWPARTHQRVWMHVLLYTGLRRGDAVKLGKQHVRDGVAVIRTEKNDTEVSIPIRPVLKATLADGPVGDLAFIVGLNGAPLTKESFGNYFREACQAVGFPRKKGAHGLRKLAATKAAEAGATVNELEALFGWQGGGMAAHYTRKADRKRLAKRASDKLEKVRGATGIPQLNQ
jgi:integrase